jgi:hypothetical protein
MARNIHSDPHEWDRFNHESCDDIDSLRDEYDKLRRLLVSTVRAYNSVKEELEIAREALGIYKTPFPILRLPREIRDQIYEHVLQALGIISPEPCPSNCFSLEKSTWRPTTPDLCLVNNLNKQVYGEAVQVLYSKNTFCFERAGQLLEFEKVIGPSNCGLVEHIEIDVNVTGAHQGGLIADPDLVVPCDWQGFPSHWAKGLMRSSLRNVLELTVIAQLPEKPSWDGKSVKLPSSLRLAIGDFFRRWQNQAVTPRLNLSGFDCIDLKGFMGRWNIYTEVNMEEPFKEWVLEPRVKLADEESEEEADG